MEKVNSNNMRRKKHFHVSRPGFAGYLRHHGFAVVQALKSIVTAPLVSLLTLAVIAFAMALPLLLWSVLENFQSLTHSWESTQISVFLKKDIPANETQRLLQQLQQHPQIARIEYIPASQGIKDFELKTGISNVLVALQDNPLPDVITLYPVDALQTPAQIAALTAELKTEPVIESVQFDMAWVERLHAFSMAGQKIVYGLAIILGIGVLLIIINTIRSISQTAQVKIQVVKLIGGSNRFIRRPFLYMGLFYSVVGSGLAMAAVNYSLKLLDALMLPIADLYHTHIVLQGLPPEIIYKVLLISAVSGYAGAWLSLANQLRKAENY